MATTTNPDAFDVVLADDFSGGYKTENWGYAFDGGTYWNGAFVWSNDDVNVRDGTMQVTVTRHGDGSWTTGGFNSFKAGKTITYGTIEFMGKVEESQGTMGVFLTWPDENQGLTWPVHGEIDILETPGQDVMHTTHWEDAASGEHWYDSVRNQSYDETQWNHYELLWLPDYLGLKVNGNVVAEWTDPAMIPDVAHGIGGMGMVASASDEWMGGTPDASTPAVTTAYMDDVVMSQWDGTAIDVEAWRAGTGDGGGENGGGENGGGDKIPTVTEFGEGPDELVLKVSQDAYQGDARYTVSVDGAQVGGEFAASALRSSGQSDTLTLKGDWGPGEHRVEVRFLNDAWGGTAETDRNLHVDAAAYNGQALEGAAQSVLTDSEPGAFAFSDVAAEPGPEHPPVANTAGEGPDTLELRISQDAYQGSAEYQVLVDGQQVGGTFAASALHGSGQSDTLTLMGDWGPGEHAVEVRFLNDAYGGTAETDRNLHVDGATYNGQAVDGAAQTVWGDQQPGAFSFTDAAGPGTEEPAAPVFVGTAGADLFDVAAEGGTFTGGAGRDLYLLDAGDGRATVTDFATGTDKLVFAGFDAADVAAAGATEDGVAGLLLTYGGEDGGAVFLQGVSALAARDMVFA